MKRQGQASNSSGLGRIAPCRIQIRQGATIVQSQEDDGAECQSWSNRAFQYADGALVLGDIKAGDKLTLCAERDNPHDPEAVAIYYGNTKLGYVPGNEVGPLSLMMYYGHEDVFEARVQQVAPERSPWHQVRVGLYVVDAR